MSLVTTHVLDTSRGVPGSGIAVELARVSTPAGPIATGVTDDDGRVSNLGPDELPAGEYRLTFDTRAYFAELEAAFFPSVSITFTTAPGERHYHVPLLLAPFAYSTYRGS